MRVSAFSPPALSPQPKAGVDSTATGRNGLTYATFTNGMRRAHHWQPLTIRSKSASGISRKSSAKRKSANGNQSPPRPRRTRANRSQPTPTRSLRNESPGFQLIRRGRRIDAASTSRRSTGCAGQFKRKSTATNQSEFAGPIPVPRCGETRANASGRSFPQQVPEPEC